MLEDYLDVKTGQDLIDKGVVPKDSSSHVSLIALKRLEIIRDKILKNLNDEMLGAWFPATAPITEDRSGELPDEEITDPETIMNYARLGMRIVGTGKQEETDITGLEGTIKEINKRYNWLEIDYDKEIPEGQSWDNRCREGHGLRTNPQNLKLLAPGKKLISGYEITKGVVADKQLGHKIRFARSPTGTIMDENGYNIDGALPAGTIATLVEYNKERGQLMVKTDENVEGMKNRRYFRVNMDSVYDRLEASSLGQIAPLEKEKEVRRQTLIDFFPKTVLDAERAESIIIGLLMGKDMIFYGPAGAGKSEVAKDIVEIYKQKGISFIVEGCKVQCNPFSLFDEDFAKVVPPCPECMIKYDSKFKDTGRFKRPKPKDVKVIVAECGDGFGVEYTEGTVSFNRMHLAGYKLPKLDGSTTSARENDYDPEGFRPGALVRTNNGVLFMDEMDKLRPQALDNILEALNSNRIKPDQLRFSYPAHALIVGTANDHTVFSQPLNDRMLLLAIKYPEDADVSRSITRSTYHGEADEASEVEIGETHKENGNNLRKIPLCDTIERAVDVLYMKFRKEYNGAGKNEISGSNRSKFDALDAARAIWLVDHIFYEKTPEFPDETYAIRGIQYAIASRMQIANAEEEQKAKEELAKWIAKEFPDVLKREEETWWCRVYKDIAVTKTQIPDIEDNFVAEIVAYKKDPEKAVNFFKEIKHAYQNPKSNRAQAARIQYPFMDYLFKVQPNFMGIDEDQLHGLMGYFVASKKRFDVKDSKNES